MDVQGLVQSLIHPWEHYEDYSKLLGAQLFFSTISSGSVAPFEQCGTTAGAVANRRNSWRISMPSELTKHVEERQIDALVCGIYDVIMIADRLRPSIEGFILGPAQPSDMDQLELSSDWAFLATDLLNVNVKKQLTMAISPKTSSPLPANCGQFLSGC